ncbi:MAG: dTDP-4-dehydrorhamnose 3,5-epimerase family protein [Armatimonadetes bacterium]|nr:dTDP-4-dehydrorhamnose 3,5-epimerase family protein [Armatimonadota bacterium]
MIESQIPGVTVTPLSQWSDARGWLIELFREDGLAEDFRPVMGYVSMTLPGVARGPHEHEHQTDGFAFISGKFDLYLWENRPGHPERHEKHSVGEGEKVFITVPPGVVHAYKNVGAGEGLVLNFPDKLYAGWGKKEPVDEIRHENDEASRFQL